MFKNRTSEVPPNSYYHSLYPKIIQDIEVRKFMYFILTNCYYMYYCTTAVFSIHCLYCSSPSLSVLFQIRLYRFSMNRKYFQTHDIKDLVFAIASAKDLTPSQSALPQKTIHHVLFISLLLE